MRMIESLRHVASLRARVLPWALVVLVMATVPFLYFEGRTQGKRTQESVEHSRTELEKKILTWIVERNPQATIRDFAEFPRFVLEVSSETDLDFRVVLAMIDKESGFKPDAIGKSGEIGLMQILPSTAELVVKRLGLAYTPPTRDKAGVYASLGSLGDARFNVRVGAKYLRWQIDRYGLNATALRAYNRNPDHAREHRPLDRYAEEVSFRFLTLAHALR